MELNDQMRIIVQAEDVSPGHVVEAGFDVFRAEGTLILGSTEIASLGLTVYPNPSINMITLRSETAWEGEKQITIFDNLGKVVLQQELTDPEMVLDINRLVPGMYALQIIGSNKVSESIKFSKI
jgi:alpha-mannosidase